MLLLHYDIERMFYILFATLKNPQKERMVTMWINRVTPEVKA